MRMRGGPAGVRVSRELAEALRALARGEGATLFMAVLAAAAALLHRDSGQERLILGANNANRNRPEIEPVLGCFLTQVPFPIDLTGDPDLPRAAGAGPPVGAGRLRPPGPALRQAGGGAPAASATPAGSR